MSAADVDLVRRWFEGLRKGDVVAEICHPDITIRNWDEAPDPGPYHGIDGLHQWWADVESAFEAMRFELVELTEGEDGSFVSAQRIVGTFRLTGIELDHTWGSVITVRDGKIASARGYLTPKKARRAAGIETSGDSDGSARV